MTRTLTCRPDEKLALTTRRMRAVPAFSPVTRIVTSARSPAAPGSTASVWGQLGGSATVVSAMLPAGPSTWKRSWSSAPAGRSGASTSTRIEAGWEQPTTRLSPARASQGEANLRARRDTPRTYRMPRPATT